LSFIQTASPSNNVSWHGMLTDLILLRHHNLADTLDKYLKIVGNKYLNKIFYNLMNIGDAFYPSIEEK